MENEFLTGGLLLGLFAYLATQFRRVPYALYKWLDRNYTTMVMFDNFDSTYRWGEAWLNKYSSKFNTYHHRIRQPKGTAQESDAYEIMPTPGIYWLKYEGKRVLMYHSRVRSEFIGGDKGHFETIYIWYWGKDPALSQKIVKEAAALANKQNPELTQVYINDYGTWKLHCIKPGRKIETVMSDDKSGIIKDLESFNNSRKRYEELGIIYKRGYLLDGPPGNGKTSLVLAIASHFNLPIYTLHLGSVMSDQFLMSLLSNMPYNALLLIEDIDAYFEGREVIGDSKVSFSGLLNVFDGVTSRDGQIVFMTTNNFDTLDEALVRPGRVDYRLTMDYDSGQISAMYNKFYNGIGSKEDLKAFTEELDGNESMATVQEMLLRRV